jgi:hypothetical protein
MKITIEIDCDNAAFEDGHGGMLEASSILGRASKILLFSGPLQSKLGRTVLLDSNGNTVGHCTVSD